MVLVLGVLTEGVQIIGPFISRLTGVHLSMRKPHDVIHPLQGGEYMNSHQKGVAERVQALLSLQINVLHWVIPSLSEGLQMRIPAGIFQREFHPLASIPRNQKANRA